jgi:hypothetical protein
VADDLISEVAVEMAAPVERMFGELAELQGALTALVVADGMDRRLASADLQRLRRTADALLRDDRLAVGAGVVMEPGFLIDADRCIEWRQRGRDGRTRPLVLDVNPSSEDPYDYPAMEWFRIPRDERRRMVRGPYFDYRGADRFTLTFGLPVVVESLFIGVAGADVPLSFLESELLPSLRRIPQRVALLNHEQRVVTANTPHYATGVRIRDAAGGTYVNVLEDLGWRLLVSE